MSDRAAFYVNKAGIIAAFVRDTPYHAIFIGKKDKYRTQICLNRAQQTQAVFLGSKVGMLVGMDRAIAVF